MKGEELKEKIRLSVIDFVLNKKPDAKWHRERIKLYRDALTGEIMAAAIAVQGTLTVLSWY